MEHKVVSGIWGTMFGVPYVVADNFLKLATGAQIKVLLYILRSSGRMLSPEEIASGTGVSPAEAEDAVLFWEQANVLAPLSSEAAPPLSPIMREPPAAPTAPEPNERQMPLQAQSSRRQNLSPSQIAELIESSQDISELFSAAEAILGMVAPAMQNSLIWMHSYLGLKKEVILTLVCYCNDIDKRNPSYMEKIAAEWSESDINTLEAATEEVERLQQSRQFEGRIMQLFEMKRRPTEKQRSFISQWQSLGLDLDMLHYAYEKCVENTEKLSFSYINKVALSWKDSGFTSVREVKEAEKEHRRRSSSGSSQGGDDLKKYEEFINKF
ncbi:MAG: DnaD domain protein [Ruminococcus sp.]|nr:DnaD domain protein [Ruminococcus sp.]